MSPSKTIMINLHLCGWGVREGIHRARFALEMLIAETPRHFRLFGAPVQFSQSERRDVDFEPSTTVVTKGPPAVVLTEEDIDACRFRMFQLHEIAAAMAMRDHVDGSEYQVLGNKRERMAQYGNAVTPPTMQLLVGRLLEVLG